MSLLPTFASYVSAPNSYLLSPNVVPSSFCNISLPYYELQKLIKTNEDFNTQYNLLKVQYDNLKIENKNLLKGLNKIKQINEENKNILKKLQEKI
jgi:hypothetical protein